MTLHCAELCFNKDKSQLADKGGATNQLYLQDDMTRIEKACMINCFHKSFRYLAHANSVYALLTANQETQKEIF